jgi:hypothetical protein
VVKIAHSYIITHFPYAIEKASAMPGFSLQEEQSMFSTLLLILLVLLLVGALPAWPYSRGWGYYPSGGLGLVLVVILVLLLIGII